MEGDINKKRKAGIDLDWNKLLPRKEDEEAPPLLVVSSTAGGATEGPQSDMEAADQDFDGFCGMTDYKLEEDCVRIRATYDKLASKLPDKGGRLKAKIKRYEQEIERRKRSRIAKDDGVAEKPTQSYHPSINGMLCGFRQGDPSSERKSQFGLHFCQKMEENQANWRTVDALEKSSPTLGRCDIQKITENGLNSRDTAFRSPSALSVDVDKQNVSNEAHKSRHSSPSSSPNTEEDLSSSFSKRNAPKVQLPKNSRSRTVQTVVLVDEEEAQLVERVQEENKFDGCIKENKIYYPSRDDPESVEISYADMECLAPETYLSSTIMNFYIRYLQQPTSVTDKARCSYHFFTTYFYEKLKEAVVNKTSHKENLFTKFRRWWRGVNIFEKSYIFLPIHEEHHWSLIIICIPDKEDESGPILLHLDSLGLHSSRPIFDNIKSFLKKEWSYLNENEACKHYPIADRIWQNLPRRIDEKQIAVPQQNNEYDCGLFVLFFMERFLEEAPQRLRKKDLAMFGKKWFNPKEASDLRLKIRGLLEKKFEREGG